MTTLQHKLRVLMKCYTVVNFQLYDDDTFTFKKTHKINGLKMDDPKEHEGRFEIQELEDNHINLRLIVGDTKTKEDENSDK